jgi:xylan 1,4-beta-xylosidase
LFQGEIAIRPLNASHLWNNTDNLTNVCLTKSFILDSAFQTLNESVIIAAYQAGPVLKVHQQESRFLYREYFPNIASVLEFASNERDQLLKKTVLFTDTVTKATIGEAAQSVIACGFQNYLVNTWWVQGKNHEDHFFVWEGWCSFHSTLDVEYNNSWFTLLYWPELLEKQLEAWYANLQPDGFPSHDLGILLEINKQAYPHYMPVEESCNLILLTYAIWRFRGYLKWHEYLPELIKTIHYLLASDTTGNGYPNLGVANTVDDAAVTVQYAKEQTYLAVKVLSALTAFSELAKDFPESDVLKSILVKSDDSIAEIRNTMETKAWLGDHYAVCLPQSSNGLHDVWTGKQIQEEDLIGWDAYSLYTSNGLLWLLATGLKPDLDYNRLIVDLQNAVEKSITPFGCTHSSIDRSNVWLSQNMWRDMIAAYLGVDYSAMMERYWRFLEWENAQGRGGCYVDTYGWNWLSYYPRGITAFGILAGSMGMQINTQQRTIELAPVHSPCRFPLVILADWKEGTVPWVECWFENGDFLWKLEGQRPTKWKINLRFGKEVTIKEVMANKNRFNKEEKRPGKVPGSELTDKIG